MNRRAVITGMGLISPVGSDVPTAWENLKSGKCGIGEITKFDTEPFKEYEHARARGAKTYAELCGCGPTCDACRITAPEPSGEGGARAIADAVRGSGMDTDRIYINAHGAARGI